MPLPSPLSRRLKNVHKNSFGHVLVLAGSANMLGAAALCSLSVLRSGAGLVTLGIPKGLNLTAQKKISCCIMTLPLEETKEQTLSLKSYPKILKFMKHGSVVALGPGLSEHKNTQQLVRKIIKTSKLPLVIDADAINALAGHLELLKYGAQKILTPHPGEMARLLGQKKSVTQDQRIKVAKSFAKKYKCVLLLKGNETLVADPNGRVYKNKTGNSGMATAGSGDVLTGMIAAFLAQGLTPFEAAKWGAYIHGMAGDLAAGEKTRLAMIASDILDFIPQVIRKVKGMNPRANSGLNESQQATKYSTEPR